jgi:hypothetical protein
VQKRFERPLIVACQYTISCSAAPRERCVTPGRKRAAVGLLGKKSERIILTLLLDSVKNLPVLELAPLQMGVALNSI